MEFVGFEFALVHPAIWHHHDALATPLPGVRLSSVGPAVCEDIQPEALSLVVTVPSEEGIAVGIQYFGAVVHFDCIIRSIT